MAPTNLPDDNHVFRFCKKALTIRNDDDEVIGIFPQIFELREERDEKYLSVSWMECLDTQSQISAEKTFKALISKFTLKPKDALIQLHVKTVKDVALSNQKKYRILNEPKKWNSAYSAIRGVPRNPDNNLNLAICSTAVRRVFLWKDCA